MDDYFHQFTHISYTYYVIIDDYNKCTICARKDFVQRNEERSNCYSHIP